MEKTYIVRSTLLDKDYKHGINTDYNGTIHELNVMFRWELKDYHDVFGFNGYPKNGKDLVKCLNDIAFYNGRFRNRYSLTKN